MLHHYNNISRYCVLFVWPLFVVVADCWNTRKWKSLSLLDTPHQKHAPELRVLKFWFHWPLILYNTTQIHLLSNPIRIHQNQENLRAHPSCQMQHFSISPIWMKMVLIESGSTGSYNRHCGKSPNPIRKTIQILKICEQSPSDTTIQCQNHFLPILKIMVLNERAAHGDSNGPIEHCSSMVQSAQILKIWHNNPSIRYLH